MVVELVCPNCGSDEVVDHRSPSDKAHGFSHWYCKSCKGDW